MAYKCSECTYLDENTGDLYGKFYCEKRCERHLATDIECSRFTRAYSRGSSTISNLEDYSREKSSGGGCFITTMLCNILGLSDNNRYLTTLRNFRGNVLQKDKKYKNILVEYDIVGPKIAEALNNDPRKKVVAYYYFEHIERIVNLIENNKKEEAVNAYITMTKALEEFYNIGNTILTIEQIDNADLSKSGHGYYITKKGTLA